MTSFLTIEKLGNELQFADPTQQVASCYLHVRNPTNMRFVYKIISKPSGKIRLSNECGVIEPGAAARLGISFKFERSDVNATFNHRLSILHLKIPSDVAFIFDQLWVDNVLPYHSLEVSMAVTVTASESAVDCNINQLTTRMEQMLAN